MFKSGLYHKCLSCNCKINTKYYRETVSREKKTTRDKRLIEKLNFIIKKENVHCAKLVLVFRYHHNERSFLSLKNINLSDYRKIIIVLVYEVSKPKSNVKQCKFSLFFVKIWFFNQVHSMGSFFPRETDLH